MTRQALLAMRELDSRTNDGIDVRLLWDPDDGRIAIAVADSKSGEQFGFEVSERERARQAFRHPFSYAASRGIGTAVDTVALSGLAV
jgi:hypothetical protein